MYITLVRPSKLSPTVLLQIMIHTKQRCQLMIEMYFGEIKIDISKWFTWILFQVWRCKWSIIASFYRPFDVKFSSLKPRHPFQSVMHGDIRSEILKVKSVNGFEFLTMRNNKLFKIKDLFIFSYYRLHSTVTWLIYII